jgi:O-antigen/teichoic acid export membrane protein
VIAPSFFQFLYDDRYHAASWMAQLAMVALWFAILNDSAGRALLALGDSRSIAVSSIARAIAAALGCIVGYALGAVPGLILGGAAGALCGYGVVAYQLSRVGLSTIRFDMLHSVVGLTIGALICGAPWVLLGPGKTGREIAAATLVIGALVLGPYGIYVARLAHRELRRA